MNGNGATSRRGVARQVQLGQDRLRSGERLSLLPTWGTVSADKYLELARGLSVLYKSGFTVHQVAAMFETIRETPSNREINAGVAKSWIARAEALKAEIESSGHAAAPRQIAEVQAMIDEKRAALSAIERDEEEGE